MEYGVELIVALQALKDRVRTNKQLARQHLTKLPDLLHEAEKEVTGDSEYLLCVRTGGNGEVKVTTWLDGYGESVVFVRIECTKQGLLLISTSEDDEDRPADTQVACHYDPSLITDQELATIVLRTMEEVMEGYIEDYDKITKSTSQRK